MVLRENPNAPPTPEEAYSFETDFSEEEVDEQGIPLADKEPGSPAPSSESEDKMAASSGAANHDGDTSPAEESVEESSEAAASDVVFIKATPPPHAERAEYLLIKTMREVKQEDSGDEVASPHVVATPQPNRRNATASWHHLPSKVWLLKSPIYNSQATVRLERLEPYGQNRVTYGFEDQGSGVKLVLKLGAHGDEVGLSRTYSGFCASVVWHGTFKVRWATHSESTASVSLIPAILQERVELATTFLELQGVDSKGSVEFLTYSTVVLAVLRATGVELLDTGASNLGVNSAAVPQPNLQLFDLGSWYLVHPPKVPSMRWTGFRALLDNYAPARSGWIRTVLARLGSTRLMVSTLLQECQSYREVLIEQGILLSDGSLDPAIGRATAQ